MATKADSSKIGRSRAASMQIEGAAAPARIAGRRRSGGKSKIGAAEFIYGVPVPDALHEVIENERGNLSKAESVLGCLAISMEYEGDPIDRPYYPDVAQLARDLVRQSINGLDSLAIQRRLLRNKIKECPDAERIGGSYRLFEVDRRWMSAAAEQEQTVAI
jgi:hypothetical protein